MKTKEEIDEVLKECKNTDEDEEMKRYSDEGGDFINQGWIEALEWVLKEGDKDEQEEDGEVEPSSTN